MHVHLLYECAAAHIQETYTYCVWFLGGGDGDGVVRPGWGAQCAQVAICIAIIMEIAANTYMCVLRMHAICTHVCIHIHMHV